MYYSEINPCDALNGIGFRVTIWVSGCSHNCKGCFNPLTHNPNYGKPYTQQTEDEILEYLSKPYIQGITLTGGHPLEPYNLLDIECLIDKIKERYNNKDIWLYTPYTWEEIINDKTLKRICSKCDVIIDGKYINECRDITLKFRGSTNQRLIDVKQSIKKGKVIQWNLQ